MRLTGATRRARWPRCLAAVILICAGAAARASAEYRTIELEGLRILFDSDWVTRAAPGYLPVRFEITNLGDVREIELVGEGHRFFRSAPGVMPGGSVIRQIVRLARGDRVRLTLPIPIYADSESISFLIRENRRTLERFGFTNLQSRVMPRDASTVIVADLGTPLATRAAAWARPDPHTSGTRVVSRPGTATSIALGTGASMDLVLDPARLPSNWLGYTTLRAVLIGSDEWQKLADAQRTALLAWTAAGGDLIVVDSSLAALQLPETGQPLFESDFSRRYFFGRVHATTSALIDAAGLAGTLIAMEGFSDAEWALPANGAPDWGKIAGRGFRLPIPGIEGVPARAYVLILLVFSLLIGPVNYWILRRYRRQVLVVLTAPLLSAAFIVLLATYAVAIEGLAVYGRATTFTMLDQVSRQASTRAAVSLYAAGMTPSGGLRFPRDLAVFPLGRDGLGTRERLVLDLTETQRMSSGVVQARSPANFEQISHRPARERLSFQSEQGALAVVNGLGETVSGLLYRQGDTVYTLNGPLPPGSKSVLRISAASPQTLVPADLPAVSKFMSIVENQPPGSYLAVLERSPFWDPGVPAIIERGSFHLVMGWPERVR